MTSMMDRGGRLQPVRVALLALMALLPGHARAQVPAAEKVTVDPITCWWRTSTGAVRVGLPFSLVLTCSLLETEAARTVLEPSRLDPAAVQLAPWEVVSGTHVDDLRTASRRFVQYDYTLRILAEDAFGQDLTIPPLPLTYRIETRAERGAVVQGRDQTYVMPALAMRVVSLVPDTATDIQEASSPTFSTIATLELRGRLLRVIAVALVTLAGVAVLAAFVGRLRRRRTVETKASRFLSDAAILGAVRRELVALQASVRASGWGPATTARALAALRVVGAYALGRPVTQMPSVPGRPPLDGQLALRGPVGPTALVSSGVTADAVSEAIARGVTGGPALDDLRDGLARFTMARYGRRDVSPADRAALDDALDAGLRLARQLAARHTVSARVAGSLRRSLDGWRARVWAG